MSDPVKKLRPSRKAIQSDEAWKRIVDTARKLEFLQHLQGNNLKRVLEADALLKQTKNSLKRQKYRLFLYSVLQKCGQHVVLLCAIALGQTNIISMKKKDCATLLDKLGENQNRSPIDCAIIRCLANRHITSSAQHQERASNLDLSKSDKEDAASVGSTCDFPSAICSAPQPSQLTEHDPRNYDFTTVQSEPENFRGCSKSSNHLSSCFLTSRG
jgi:hypothetical protein